MATGIIGVLSGAGTITYTPVNPAKVRIQYNGQSSATLNGVAAIPGSSGVVELWVGAGQTMALALAAGYAVVSCLES